MRAKFEIVIRYEGDIPDDPDSYEGAQTSEERIAKEREYLVEEDRDYLFQALSCIPHTVEVKITPVN